MTDDIKKGNEWIKIKLRNNDENIPKELRIDFNGNVYLDGELYDETTSKYKNLNVDVEKHNRLSSGEETQKLIEQSKKAKKGETITIKDEKGPDRRETTTVKF